MQKINARVIGILFWTVTIVLFIVSIVQALVFEEAALQVIGNLGIVGIFFIAFFSDFLVQPIGPDIPLIIGIITPQISSIVAVIVVFTAVVLAYLVTYYIGRKIGGPGIEAIIGRKKYKKLVKHEKLGRWIVFIGAISPVPYIPYLAGVWKFTLKESIFVVILPRFVRLGVVFWLTVVLREQFIKYLLF